MPQAIRVLDRLGDLADFNDFVISFDGGYETGDESNWLDRPPAQIHNEGTGSSFAAITSDKRVGTYAGAFTAGATDGSAVKRSEVQTYLGDTQDDDVYYAWSTKFPTGFSTPSWANILQMYPREFSIPAQVQLRIYASFPGGESGPANSLFIARCPGSLESGAPETATRIVTGLNVGSWQDFIMRVKWSTGSDGVITIRHRVQPTETWTQVYTFSGQTLQSRYADGTGPGSNYARQGFYRAADTDASARTVYHDCFARTISFEAAERAFAAAPTIQRRKIVASRGVATGDVATFEQIVHLQDRRANGTIFPHLGAFTSLAYVDNTMYGFRFYNDHARQLRKVTFAITTAATNNDAFDLVILDSAGTTDILRITAKSGLLNSTGVKTLTSTALGGSDFTEVVLAADTVYHLAWAARNTGGAPVIWAKTIGTGFVADLAGAAVGERERFSKATSYPIPTTTPLASVSAAAIVPVFCLRDA